jgi:TolB protein
MTPTPLALISEDASLRIAQIRGEGAAWSAEIETRLDMKSEGMVFMWPSWSPTGEQIAVSASSQRREEPKLELWCVPRGEGPAEPIFQNPRDGRQVIAAGLAHYVNWSPSGRALAVVGNVGSGLAVNLVAGSGQGRPQRLVDGAPMYFSWSPDGRAILVHRAAQLVLFDLTASSEGPIQIQRVRPSFRSPAWSPDGSAFYFAKPRPGGGSIIVGARRNEVGSGSEHEDLMELSGPASFVASRSDHRLAVLTLTQGDAEGRQLTILDPVTGVQQPVIDRAINGICWAPDGRAVFAFEPQPSSTMIALTRYDLDRDGEYLGGQRLARFQPSAEFATMLNFHDQFAHSHQIVSPCGNWITFAGLALGNGGSGRRGFGPQNGCYIVPADGSAPPRRVSAGSISFFPPHPPAETN